MNKTLLISAAVSMAFSGAALAEKNMRFGASASQYIDSSVEITANDCHSLSVEAARDACLRSAQSNVGGTSGGAGGTAQGSHDMKRMPSGSNESKPGSSASGDARLGATGGTSMGKTHGGASAQGSFSNRSDDKRQYPSGSNESKPGASAARGVGGTAR